MQGEIGGLNLELCPLVLKGVYGLFVFFITMLGFGGLWMERWPSDSSLKHARDRYARIQGLLRRGRGSSSRRRNE